MFSKKIARKLSVALFALSLVIVMGMSGCSKKITLEDVTDKNQPESNNNNNTDTNKNNPDSNNNPPADNERNQNIDSEVPFLNINLVGGEPPLQKKEGIFYFTKRQHPPVVDRPFRYDTHNGWLIQLEDPEYRGKEIKVQSIKKSGNIFDITVRLKSGGDIKDPAFGFFEVGINDMPTSAQFRIYNDAGQKLWPNF